MKDYCDIYYIANRFDFDGRKLQEAIYETLQSRGTVYERDSLKRIIGFVNEDSMNIKWRHFLKS